MAFQTFEAIKEQLKLDQKSKHIKDEVYHRNVVERSLKELIDKYLEEDTILQFQVRQQDLDALIDVIENGTISNIIEFRQIKPLLFEMQYKRLNIFN